MKGIKNIFKRKSADPELEHNKLINNDVELETASLTDLDELAEDLALGIIGSFDTAYLLNSPEIAGWINSEDQRALFSVIDQKYLPYTILDVGCGRADLVGYLSQLPQSLDMLIDDAYDISKYTGIDLNKNMLEVAKRKFPGVNVIHTDLLDFNPETNYDYVFASGVFNFDDHPDMASYVSRCIEKMYQLANRAVIVNLLTEIPEFLSEEDRAQLAEFDAGDWFKYLILKYGRVEAYSNHLKGHVTFIIYK